MASPAKAFRAAAEQPTSFAFDYESEVASFYAAHPDLKNKIYFIDMSPAGSTVVRGGAGDAPEADALLRKNTYLFNLVARMAVQGQSFAIRFDPLGYNCIIVDKRAARTGLPRLTGADASADIENIYVLDHEIGHLVCRDGNPRVFNLRECAADAYATIRHLQRFGDDAAIRDAVEMRAVELIFRPDRGDHFTSPVTQAILADAATVDFKALTPAETAEAANNYALSHVTHPRVLEYAYQTFRAFSGRLPALAAGDMTILKDVAEAVLNTPSPFEFKWGALALRAILDGKVLCDGVRIQPQGTDAARLRKKLDKREQAFAARHGLPFEQPVPQPANNNAAPPPANNTSPPPVAGPLQPGPK